MLGNKSDFAPVAAPGSDAKYAATFAMSSGESCAATATMVAAGAFGDPALREPSLNAFSWFSMYPARCAARFGMLSLTLTPAAPWHAPQTVATFALPASMSAAFTAGAGERRAARTRGEGFIGAPGGVRGERRREGGDFPSAPRAGVPWAPKRLH